MFPNRFPLSNEGITDRIVDNEVGQGGVLNFQECAATIHGHNPPRTRRFLTRQSRGLLPRGNAFHNRFFPGRYRTG